MADADVFAVPGFYGSLNRPIFGSRSGGPVPARNGYPINQAFYGGGRGKRGVRTPQVTIDEESKEKAGKRPGGGGEGKGKVFDGKILFCRTVLYFLADRKRCSRFSCDYYRIIIFRSFDGIILRLAGRICDLFPLPVPFLAF